MARAKTPRNGSSLSKSAANVSGITLEKKNNNNPSNDLEAEIRRRAYELYEQRGRTPGHESEDWLVAEREVAARYELQGA
jgi:hypothetical protein